MNDATRDLIYAIVGERQRQIYESAKKVLTTDKSAKSAKFCEKMIAEIDKKMNVMEIPPNCSMFTMVEMEAKINLDRYYLTERESKQVEKIKKMYSVSQKLKEKDVNVINSLLLYGESGTGKTAFGRYIARELNLPFIYINLTYILSSLLGSSMQNVANLFRFINKQNCVFMLDEIDAVATKRNMSQDIGELARVTISLMQEIDKLNNDVILIGATNRFEDIDEAVISRFGNTHMVKPFTDIEKDIFVRKYLDDVGIEYTDEDINDIAKINTQRLLERRTVEFIVNKYYQEEGEISGKN